ncbi:hypothetical protein SPRG_11281 [Saprolegnia parasitica CBS 223.65]|uniref:Uncharacterized protein n=1 Tax=Saprolegnia parasitica (strain CBS 223.65) TaxID=695850 RepID=A0A067C3Y1_SAPPC|nr:hypothetical protein SPRG_11281 [Saprolegnia parasitica CBS 223.65]KDO23850.1 hypothetical protein SPRG_11281 [Saprolegnia parasitica CBS 223.65]|eukprot:XP_012205482.1 hypothetical protein SPRG_11281 [Saprolegnia parasitica CBS 223.65]
MSDGSILHSIPDLQWLSAHYNQFVRCNSSAGSSGGDDSADAFGSSAGSAQSQTTNQFMARSHHASAISITLIAIAVVCFVAALIFTIIYMRKRRAEKNLVILEEGKVVDPSDQEALFLECATPDGVPMAKKIDM